MAVVSVRDGPTERSAFGVSGLVVLFLLLGGFVAMHGVAATTEAGVHHDPIMALAAADDHMAEQLPAGNSTAWMAQAQPQLDMQVAAAGSVAPAAAGTSEGDDTGASHRLMVGCVVVLFGVIAAVVLRLLKPLRTISARALERATLSVQVLPDRPPPRRSPISLCVLRV